MVKIETRKIAKVHDQTNVPSSNYDLLVLGPEVAWAFNKSTADTFAARHADRKLKVCEDMVDIVTMEDGSIARLDTSLPLDPSAERKAAKAALLARLSPDERALLEEP